MADVLKRRGARIALLTALPLALAAPAAALGPSAPFAPPTGASPPSAPGPQDSTAPRTTASPADGLAGVRLGGTPLALIDGQWWRLGQQLRGGTLVAVHARGVQLQFPDGRRQALWLTPTPAAPDRTR